MTKAMMLRGFGRLFVIMLLLLVMGLTACGRRGGLDRPPPIGPQTKADPETHETTAPARHFWIDRLLE
jgi:predicted small lipoprotein YifL